MIIRGGKMSIQTLFDLTGRTALVTGGGRGIGRSISQALASAGAELMLVGRNVATLERARAELTSQFETRVEVHSADLSNTEAVSGAAAAALDRFGHIDILVHNAGMPSTGTIETFTDENWDRVYRTNLLSGVNLTRTFIPKMKERNWGRVIYISSAAAYRALPSGHSAYSASKSALHGFARTAAVELGPHGITVNCIAAGIFLTDMAREAASDAGLTKLMADMSAVKRLGDTRDMEGPILLLASDAGRFIFGSVMFVDGGFTAQKG
jgi:NAD(P)-dependent dehydrogenase (short-subunit alcohol dehydrogenase family)